MSIQVQSEDYTDTNSHPIKLLVWNNGEGAFIIRHQVPEQIDAKSVCYEFEIVYCNNDWNKLAPPLFVFDGRCVWHEDKTINHSWWEFKGTIIPATVPEWGEISHG